MHLESFNRHEAQLEHWLKGELLPFLDSEVNGRLKKIATEVRPDPKGRGRVDLQLLIPDGSTGVEVWIELKHLHIGLQKGESYKASDYFSDKSSTIYKDVVKLNKIKPSGDKYILILCTKNPDSEGNGNWSESVDTLNQMLQEFCPPLRVSSLTDPSGFPQTYFLGLLKVTCK
jgi:hypothetical protein|tara:strand:- start:292 stop:810 length:519 start_codon:yes stop_codon:yes gene_type:complete